MDFEDEVLNRELEEVQKAIEDTAQFELADLLFKAISDCLRPELSLALRVPRRRHRCHR